MLIQKRNNKPVSGYRFGDVRFHPLRGAIPKTAFDSFLSVELRNLIICAWSMLRKTANIYVKKLNLKR